MKSLVKYLAESMQINEFEAGGNDWGKTYSEYRNRHKTNRNLDNAVENMHTICQYAEDLNKITLEEMDPKDSKYFNKLSVDACKELDKHVSAIFGLMANRTNIEGDKQAIKPEDIKELQKDFEFIADCGIDPLDSAAKRLVSWCKEIQIKESKKELPTGEEFKKACEEFAKEENAGKKAEEFLKDTFKDLYDKDNDEIFKMLFVWKKKKAKLGDSKDVKVYESQINEFFKKAGFDITAADLCSKYDWNDGYNILVELHNNHKLASKED